MCSDHQSPCRAAAEHQAAREARDAAVRAAVRADPGWKLVVADAAQLEPRVLAAMSGDERMAHAATGGDLYQALADQGVVETRQHAKIAMLGAM